MFINVYKKFEVTLQENYTFFNDSSICLFFDRIDFGGDNAEMIYVDLINNKNCYFVVSKTARDYNVFKKKGYNILEFGSEQFERLYLKCDYIFSSSYDLEISNYNNMRKKSKHKFIFLQHGVLISNLSEQLLNIKIDLIVVSTYNEYNFLLKNYHFKDNQIIKSGLARFDMLEEKSEKYLIIAMTWRSSFVKIKDGNFFDNIINSEYMMTISEIINNKKLVDYCSSLKITLKIIMHPFFKDLKKDLSDFFGIEVLIVPEYSYYISHCYGVISDYSSIIYDAAYLNKKVVLLQKDTKKFYKQHIHNQGLIYGTQTPGVICYKIDDIFNVLKDYPIENHDFFINKSSHRKFFWEKMIEKYGEKECIE